MPNLTDKSDIRKEDHQRLKECLNNIEEDPIHIHDLNATLLHCLGLEHTRLTFKYQGRHHRLTDVHGHLVKKMLA